MKVDLLGSGIQCVRFILSPGETMQAEPGSLVSRSSNVTMNTNLSGGFFSGLKRAITGANLFLSSFTNNSDGEAEIIVSSPIVGNVLEVDLSQMMGGIKCHQDSFIACAGDVVINPSLTNLKTGFFGGNGFVLQHLSGTGTAFIHGGGLIIERDLSPGEVFLVETENLLGFESSVKYDVKFTKGISNAIFGGEGLFTTHLTGPGKIYVQGAPFRKMVERISNIIKREKQSDNDIKISLGLFQ